MMSETVQIGKFTLESLTTGMYSEPESCFREYIQNAVDSLDDAIHSSIMTSEECRIEIIVNSDRQEISIKDNGTGISQASARRILLGIGNSTKQHTSNRGFRGIGRLGGLSYCKKLSFCTTAQGEDTKTIVTFDCEKLRELLVPGKHMEHSLQSVIEEVTTVQVLQEQLSSHYFIVKMENVDDISSLLDLDMVRDYVSQVAPAPFRKRFFWGEEIKKVMKDKGYQISEYPIFIGDSFETLSQVFKPYKLTLEVSSRAGINKDEILGLSFFDLIGDDSKPIGYGWYADTSFSGTLADDKISGIRVRQGNIQIGSARALSSFFKESRFNAWSMGELYILSDDLIPNARRDDFEKNDTYIKFEALVRATIGSEIPDKIRAASKARNNPMQKAIDKTSQAISSVESILKTGFNSSFEKDQVADRLEEAKRALVVIPKSAPSQFVESKKELLGKLTDLSEKVEQSTNFKTKTDIPSDFSKQEKKVVQAMMEVLTRNFERETVDYLYREFLSELKLKSKK